MSLTVSGPRAGSTHAIIDNLRHSNPSKVSLHWSPGQGMRPPPGYPMQQRGLHLTASVHKGHHLQIDSVKLNQAKKTVTVRIDARGAGTPKPATEQQEKFLSGNFPMAKAEKWTVLVQDKAGKVLSRKSMMLGGPPAC